MKTTSRFALIAAAGLMMGGVAVSSAKAADLGGDCCADLEERVAELEATTVRKGNRKVSLELSGQVNKGLLVWNDGKASDVYVTDNNASSTRFRLKGTGQMAPGWKAGFYMEYEFRDSSTNLVDQTSQVNRGIENALRIRQENVFVESEKFGRVTLGQQSTATKDIELINLGGGINDVENYYAASFKVRDNGLGNTAGLAGSIGNASRLGWGVLADSYDPGRLQAIRYDTPSIYGFILSASFAENDFWDVGIRYQKEWNSIRIAAGVGYYYSGDPVRIANGGFGDGSAYFSGGTNVGLDNPRTNTFEVVKGSISVMHIPTGLYASFMAGERSINGRTPGEFDGTGARSKDSSFFYVQAGITKRFFDVGATTFYGEYGNYDDQATGARYDGSLTGPALRITSSDVTRYGFGFTQAFDGAALELYANYVHYSADLDVRNTAGVSFNANPEDFDAVITGARIKF